MSWTDGGTGRVRPGCEPFRFEGGEIGLLLVHGFTGCPASLRPMGEWLTERGASVVAPLLPGHGTRWEDLAAVRPPQWVAEAEAALLGLAARCRTLVAVGLSFGAAVVLHLAARHPEEVSGVVVVNPYVHDPRLPLALLLRPFTRTYPGIGNDVKRAGQDELTYDRIPVVALPRVAKLQRLAERDLPSLRAPLLVFSSVDDHVVRPANARRVLRKAGSREKELVDLRNSYHVATLDYDAETIFEGTLAFATSLDGRRRARA